jgi:hypothetical protein
MKKIKFWWGFLLFLVPTVAVQGQPLPQMSWGTEYSDQYGLVAALKYANLFSPTSALGTELSVGTNEFRMGVTWAKQISCQQRLKLTTEYLSQNITFDFDCGSKTFWNGQHALALRYSYLLPSSFSSLNLSLYGTQAHDGRTPVTITSNESTLYRDVSGSNAYGVSGGLTLQPWRATTLNVNALYDTVSYHNDGPYFSGIGAGISIAQVIHPRLLLSISGLHRVIYDQYVGQISWLVPLRGCSRLEFILKGDYVSGELPQPHEARVAFVVAYRWNLQHANQTYLTPKGCSEAILDEAARPAIRMPQTLVKKEGDQVHALSLPISSPPSG